MQIRIRICNPADRIVSTTCPSCCRLVFMYQLCRTPCPVERTSFQVWAAPASLNPVLVLQLRLLFSLNRIKKNTLCSLDTGFFHPSFINLLLSLNLASSILSLNLDFFCSCLFLYTGTWSATLSDTRLSISIFLANTASLRLQHIKFQ
jgi:hypothetical protein